MALFLNLQRLQVIIPFGGGHDTVNSNDILMQNQRQGAANSTKLPYFILEGNIYATRKYVIP